MPTTLAIESPFTFPMPAMTHLPARTGQRAAILVVLAALMVATRSHLPALLTHLGPIPDAS